jgi:hypothetical protein
MQENSWVLGTPYYSTGQYSIFSQPGGPFTPVLPGSGQSAPFEAYPITGLAYTYSPWWIPGCGHITKEWKIIVDYDYTQDSQVQLICCGVCSYIQRAVPWNPNQPISPGAGGGVLNPYYVPIIVG